MDEEIIQAGEVLKRGGVVAHPTETCYGLAVDIFSRDAVARLYELKKMSLEKPVSVLLSSLEEAQKYGEFSVKASDLARKYWPGPLTIIVPRSKFLPKWINPGANTVGFRVSSSPLCKKLLKSFGGPISTTSANIHGLAQAYSVEEFEVQKLEPDFILDGGQILPEPPSTIVEILGDNIKIIRQGSLVIV